MSVLAYGLGIYTAPEAARMIGMGVQSLRRWLLGYEYRHGDDNAEQPPLWNPQHRIDNGELLLGFRDMVEARIVNALRKRGLSLQTIRMCLDRARVIVGDDRPFSTTQFKTDGRSIFLEITDGVDEPRMVDLRQRQGVFRQVVLPSLSGLEFGTEAAERWWLLNGKRTIVADPEFAFGQPTIAGRGLTTTRVAQAMAAEGSIRRVAQLYELKQGVIRDAVRFEEERGLRRAA